MATNPRRHHGLQVVYGGGRLYDPSLSVSVQQQVQPGGAERSEHEARDCSVVAVDVQRSEDEEQDEGEAGRATVNQSDIRINCVSQSGVVLT